jgi:hypothetical protein
MSEQTQFINYCGAFSDDIELLTRDFQWFHRTNKANKKVLMGGARVTMGYPARWLGIT